MKKRFTKSPKRALRSISASKKMYRKRPIKASADDVRNGYTEDLSDFGMREIEELRDILDAWIKYGLPDDFWDDKVKPAFNTNSGNVFLTNSEYQVAMRADGKLESWYFTPYDGYEGFYEDLVDEADDSWNSEDIEYLRDIAENRGDDATVDMLNELLEGIE